jgi:hypothetical protein
MKTNKEEGISFSINLQFQYLVFSCNLTWLFREANLIDVLMNKQTQFPFVGKENGK